MSVLEATGVAVVTGGSRGIGAAIAKAAAGLGFDVAVNYRVRDDKANEVVAAVTAIGRRAVAIQADVANEADVVRLFKQIDGTLGPVTALVNNAGVMPAESRVDEMSAEKLQELWRMNITSAFICSREAVRRMSRKHGGTGGVIVNVSSLAGRRGGRERRAHYAASKAALNGFTVGLANEVVREGIRVNAVCPGVTDTDFHAPYGGSERVQRLGATVPIGRAATADDVANAVAFLLSNKASYLTGILIEVAGGLI